MSIKSVFSSARSFVCVLLAILLIVNPLLGYAQSAFVSTLPEPGKMVGLSGAFTPVLVKGLVVHPDKPLNFDFIVDSGNDSAEQAVIREQSQRMAQYFLAAITVPEDQLWVNLSPFEKDRVIADELGKTVLGRDMLAQDYVLKQLTASLIYPEKGLGKEFWERIYKEAKEMFGTSDLPMDTFNKVWIMPEKAEVFEKGSAVYVTSAKLKVMLDTDYLATSTQPMPTGVSPSTLPTPQPLNTKATQVSTPSPNAQEVTKNLLREIIIPALEREVNEGQNFAVVRQVYYAAILAKWYRELIQNTLLADAYVGKNQVSGVTADEKTLKEEIYQRYIAAYKKGVFNYIKEENDAKTGEALPRKYFSGGIKDFAMKNVTLARTGTPVAVGRSVGKIFAVDLAMSNVKDAAIQEEDEGIRDGFYDKAQSPIKAYSAAEDRKALNEDIDRFMDSREPQLRVYYAYQGAKAGYISNPLLIKAFDAALRLKSMGDMSGIKRLAAYQRFEARLDGSRSDYLTAILAAAATSAFFGQNLNLPDITLESLMKEQRTRMTAIMDRPRGVEPNMATVGFIKDLKKNGVKVGIGTWGHDVDKLLTAFGLDGVDAFVDSEEMFREGITAWKQDNIEHYWAVARKIGVDPGKCVLVVSGSEKARSGMKAGFGFVIGLARMGQENSFRGKANLVISDFDNLSVEDIKAQFPVMEGVIFNMLGVISSNRPAAFYALKETLDRYFQLRADQLGEKFKEFTRDDFLVYFSGNFRDGLKLFLASRNVFLPQRLAFMDDGKEVTSTVKAIKSMGLMAGLHTKTSGRSFQSVRDNKGVAGIVEVAKVLSEEKVSPVFDDQDALKAFKLSNSGAVAGFFVSNDFEDAREAMKAGADYLVGLEYLKPEIIKTLKALNPSIGVINAVSLKFGDVMSLVDESVAAGAEGVQFGPFADFVTDPETFESASEVLKAVRAKYPDLIINGAGKLYSPRLGNVLRMPEGIIPSMALMGNESIEELKFKASNARSIAYHAKFPAYESAFDRLAKALNEEEANNKDGKNLSDQAQQGGIDIQNIDVVHKGSAKIKFNDQAIRDVLKNGFNGFTPVIINITPVASPLPLLGLNASDVPTGTAAARAQPELKAVGKEPEAV